MSVFQGSAFQTRLSMRRDLIEGFIVNSVNSGMISSSLGLHMGGDSSRKTGRSRSRRWNAVSHFGVHLLNQPDASLFVLRFHLQFKFRAKRGGCTH
jgi:hypothetical protein